MDFCERFLGQFPPHIVVAGADGLTGLLGGAVGVAGVPPVATVSPPSSIGHAVRSGIEQ